MNYFVSKKEMCLFSCLPIFCRLEKCSILSSFTTKYLYFSKLPCADGEPQCKRLLGPHRMNVCSEKNKKKNKLSLLWDEDQLCLPHVCLKKELCSSDG